MSTEEQKAQRAKNVAYWQPLIEAWQASHLPVSRYCKQHNINHDQFRYWQYQLAPETKRAPPTRSASSSFVEVSAMTKVAIPAQQLSIEIQTTHGFTIKLTDWKELHVIKSLLTVLKDLS